MNNQRRLFQRIRAEIPMSIHIGHQSMRGVSTNISMNGLFIRLEDAERQQVVTGQLGRCQLEFRGVHLTLSCEVLRRNGEELALQFVDFSPEAFAALRSLMNFTVATSSKKRRKHWLTQTLARSSRVIPLFPDIASIEGQNTP